MNGFTLDADGPRWWLAPTLAGAVATITATAIVAYPTSARTVPTPSSPRETPAAYFVLEGPPFTPTTDGTANCFIYRARWNVALDAARPTCHWRPQPGTR